MVSQELPDGRFEVASFGLRVLTGVSDPLQRCAHLIGSEGHSLL